MFDENDEVAFTWSASTGMAHAIEQLTGFTGILLTVGYPAYTTVVKRLNGQIAGVLHAASQLSTASLHGIRAASASKDIAQKKNGESHSKCA